MDFTVAQAILIEKIPNWIEGVDSGGYYMELGSMQPIKLYEDGIIQLALALSGN